mgnify:CR=1 FL=1
MKYIFIFFLVTSEFLFSLDFGNALQKFITYYGEYGYNKDGYITIYGNVKVGSDAKDKITEGFGCSVFASIMLLKMKYGENWLEQHKKIWQELHSSYKNISQEEEKNLPDEDQGRQLHQKFGCGIAKYFNLQKALYCKYKDGKRLEVHGKTNLNQLYFFDFRKNSEGHVGFLKNTMEGKKTITTMWHYSKDNPNKGPSINQLEEWFKTSLYSKGEATMELYEVSFPR